MDQSVKLAGTEGKVGGYFCRLPPLNTNIDFMTFELYNTELGAVIDTRCIAIWVFHIAIYLNTLFGVLLHLYHLVL